MTAFLLPCECTADVTVTAGQAGGSVTCPRCGRTLAIPKLRDLGGLRRQDRGRSSAGAAWRPIHAVVLLGGIVAMAAWAAGAWFAPGSTGVVNDEALRSAVLAVDDLTIYKVWAEGLSRSGVRRPPSDDEQALVRRARFAEGVRRVLHAVAAVAALAAAGAAFVVWCMPRPSAGRPSGAAAGRDGP